MPDEVRFHYDIDGDNFTSAGEASMHVKKKLRQLGFDPEIIRRISIAMYEGEINTVIHAGGGTADITIYPQMIQSISCDRDDGGQPIRDVR